MVTFCTIFDIFWAHCVSVGTRLSREWIHVLCCYTVVFCVQFSVIISVWEMLSTSKRTQNCARNSTPPFFWVLLFSKCFRVSGGVGVTDVVAKKCSSTVKKNHCCAVFFLCAWKAEGLVQKEFLKFMDLKPRSSWKRGMLLTVFYFITWISIPKSAKCLLT